MLLDRLLSVLTVVKSSVRAHGKSGMQRISTHQVNTSRANFARGAHARHFGKFGFGLVLGRVGLPPMVGFLAAGFAFNMAGLNKPQGLDLVADLGVILLLFSIGLKVDLRGLLKAVIWTSATVQILVTTALMCGVLLLGRLIFPVPLLHMPHQSILVLGFALAFSGTVFAVKVLEEKGDMTAFYGRIAIGILIMQELFAVLFLSVSDGKIPGVRALNVFALPLLRPFAQLRL